jgi:hypothetical protein
MVDQVRCRTLQIMQDIVCSCNQGKSMGVSGEKARRFPVVQGPWAAEGPPATLERQLTTREHLVCPELKLSLLTPRLSSPPSVQKNVGLEKT